MIPYNIASKCKRVIGTRINMDGSLGQGQEAQDETKPSPEDMKLVLSDPYRAGSKACKMEKNGIANVL